MPRRKPKPLTAADAVSAKHRSDLRDRAIVEHELRAEIIDLKRALESREEKILQQHAASGASVRRLSVDAKPKTKAAKHITRVVIPDSHGNHIDPVAAKAFLADLKMLEPTEIVMLGDHLDCGGTFNTHQRSYTNEIVESYVDDVAAANEFLNRICEYAPNAEIHYLAGNHEMHVERWAARNMHTRKDADRLLEVYGPEAELHLKRRGIKYYSSKEFFQGLTVRGTIKIGKCHFTHGISHSKHADATHLERFNGNVVFGHVHRRLEVGSRTVTSQGHGAWCPATLAKLQPLYRHTEPTTWTHGYGVQFANTRTGRFSHWNVPVFADGTTGLEAAVGALTK